MFANVVRARVLQGEPGEIGKEVAIKITRSQESMYALIHSDSTRNVVDNIVGLKQDTKRLKFCINLIRQILTTKNISFDWSGRLNTVVTSAWYLNP
jgi:hypothetical protein